MPSIADASLATALGQAQKPLTHSAIVGALCLFTALAGCNSQSAAAGAPGAAAGATDGSGIGASRAANPHLKVVALPDPSLGGIPAVFVAVPKDWKASGQMSMNECVSLPNPSWNASSPDGQSTFEVLPEFAWRLGASARFGRGCDPFSGTPSAAEFLKLFAAKLPDQVQIVSRIDVPDAFRKREETFTNNMNAGNANAPPVLRMRSTGDVAAVKATDASGHDLRLRGWLQCRQGTQGGNCFVKVDVLRAPKGKLDALMTQVDGPNLVMEMPDQQWLTAYMGRQQHVAQQQLDTLAGNAKAGSDMLRKQYVDSSARLQSEHEAGLQQIERQGHDANANAFNTMNAQSTASSDWRDYAADQQTVSGVNGTYKTSSQYSNVWSSPYGPALSNGRTFGSTDNTLDPNTATDNTWSQDVKVHGNGQPY
jgi:hypothetical protein